MNPVATSPSMLVLGLVCGTLLGSSAWGAVTTYTDEATFLASTEDLAFESFEGLTADNTIVGVIPISVAGFSLNHSDPGGANPLLRVYDQVADMYPADGSNYVAWRPGAANQSLIFNFLEPVQAVGFTMADPQDTAGTLSFQTDAGDAGIIFSEVLPDGSQRFFGFTTDQPFEVLTLSESNEIDTIGFDAIHYGVPEPSGLVLLALGFVGLLPIAARRRVAGVGAKRSHQRVAR